MSTPQPQIQLLHLCGGLPSLSAASQLLRLPKYVHAMQLYSICVATVGFLAFALVLALVEQAFLEGLEEVWALFPSPWPVHWELWTSRVHDRLSFDRVGIYFQHSDGHACRMFGSAVKCWKLGTFCCWPLAGVPETGKCC